MSLIDPSLIFYFSKKTCDFDRDFKTLVLTTRLGPWLKLNSPELDPDRVNLSWRRQTIDQFSPQRRRSVEVVSPGPKVGFDKSLPLHRQTNGEA